MAVIGVAITASPLLYLAVKLQQTGITALADTLGRARTLELLGSSLLLMIAVAVSAVLVGGTQAWLTVRTDLPRSRWWATAAAVPLALPSYVVAFSWLSINPQLSGFGAAWLVLTTSTAPYAYLTISAALLRADSALEDVARSLGRSRAQVLRTVLWPRIRPAAGVAALITALYTLSDFGAVSLLRYDTFTRAIYNAYRASFDRNLAAALSVVLIVVTAVLLRWQHRIHIASEGRTLRPSVQPLERWRRPAELLLGAWAVVSIIVPIAMLMLWTLRGRSSADWSGIVGALVNSLTLGALGGLLATIFAVAIALLLTHFRNRSAPFVTSSVWLAHALPGVVIALALVYFSNRLTPGLYQTVMLVVIAYSALFTANAVGVLQAPLAQVSLSLTDVARSLGHDVTSILRRVLFPIMRPSLLIAFSVVMLTSLKELPATLLLRPTGMETLATRLWTYTGINAFAAAAPYALLIVVLGGIPTWLLNAQVRRLNREATTLQPIGVS